MPSSKAVKSVMMQGEALYLKTLDQLICLKQDFEELRSKYETLEAKHTNFVFYSTPSAVVEDLQEQVDTLTAKVDKRAGKYLEKKLRCRCLTNMTTDLRTHNTSLTQVTFRLGAHTRLSACAHPGFKHRTYFCIMKIATGLLDGKHVCRMQTLMYDCPTLYQGKFYAAGHGCRSTRLTH